LNIPTPCSFWAKRYQIDWSELNADWQNHAEGKFYTHLKKILDGVWIQLRISLVARLNRIGFEKHLGRQHPSISPQIEIC
jgi:hypothetical protein